MKTKPVIVLFVVACLSCIMLSCKKDQNTNKTMVQLTAQNNGKTETLAKGQVFTVNLGNPGDGGYAFDAPVFDTNVLSISNHVHTPSTTNAIGDFGTDTWTFAAIKTGTTTLTVTATRPFDKTSTVKIFNGTFTVY